MSEFVVSLAADDPSRRWFLEIAAEEREIGGMDWCPSLSDHDFDTPWPGLDRLPGFTVDLPGPPDAPYFSPVFREAAFLLYQWDHLPVRDVLIRFGTWSPAGIGFSFTGTVELDPPATTVSVEGVLPFDGVLVVERHRERDPDPDRAAAENLLARDFDRSRFAPAVALDEHRTFFRYQSVRLTRDGLFATPPPEALTFDMGVPDSPASDRISTSAERSWRARCRGRRGGTSRPW